MSPSRVWEVFRQEFTHNLRRPLFWMLLLILGFLMLEMSKGQASISSGDSRVGGTKAWITSQFAITQLVILTVSIIYSFFVSVAAGMSLIRDGDWKVGELLHSTRLTPGEYVWGKYLAQLASFALVLVAHFGLTIVFNHVLPHGTNADYIGPFRVMNYLVPLVVFGLPILILTTGASFAIGGLTRSPILVFALPVGIVLFGAFFLWEWSPSWLALGWNQLLQVVDLSGLRWINETWLNVDRGVDYYNQRPVGLDPLIVSQRLLCVALGLGAVQTLAMRFGAQVRGATGAKKTRGTAAVVAPAAFDADTGAASLRELGMRSGAPGFVAGVLEVARIEWRELWKHPGLYLFIPMILLQTFGSVVDNGAFDTTILQTPGILAVHQMNTLTLLICMLILFYTTESLQREKSSGFGPIHYATPLRTTSLLLGKSLANTALALAILLTCLIGCWITLLVQGKVAFSLGPFALVWGLLLTPTFLFWTAFVSAAFALTGNRYGAYVAGLGVMTVTGFLQMRDKMSWAWNWDLWSGVRWSDISLFELDRTALILNRVMVLGLAALFAVIAVRVFTRREKDSTQTLHRLRPAAIAHGAITLAPWLAVPLACCVALQLMVHDGRGGAVAKKLQKDYWKRNTETWKDTPAASLAAADFDLEVNPATGWLRSRGSYVVQNRTQDTLKQIPITGGRHWKNVKWTLNGAKAEPEDRARLYVFTPSAPLPPGGRATIGFEFDGKFPGGVSKNGGGTGEFVLPSNVVLTGFSTTAFAPQLGFSEEIGVEEDKNKTDPREYPADYWRRTLPGELPMFDGWCDTHIRLTGPASLQHNVTGSLVSEKVEGGKRITEWKSDAPVRAFNVIMGKWKVKRAPGVAVYYDARHPYNVDEMLEALAAARKWYGEWFAPYPWHELRVSEFAGLATYAQGPPTNISFSEAIGFLTKSEPKANAAFWITAHEAAHQWWPGMAMPGDGPGSDVLSEGMAHFSTILLVGQAKGPQQRMAFCRQIEDRYGNTRQRDSERPLTRVDGKMPADQRIIYDRGGWAFWMLHELMGKEASLAGIREYLETYRNSEDHPLIEEYLAILRRHAPDPKAFDDYVNQWFFGTVVPQYLVTPAGVEKAGNEWVVRAKVKNVGTGVMPVEVAAVRGERFPEKKTAENAWDEQRTTLTLAAGEEQAVVIRTRFEPKKLIVDPDVRVLMLERQKAEVKLKMKAAGAALAMR